MSLSPLTRFKLSSALRQATSNTINLSSQQQSILDDPAPHKLILAAAGSGKTRLLCAAIQKRAKEVNPSGIVVLTFTNNAANEMRSRLGDLSNKLQFVGTIHSFCFKLIRENLPEWKDAQVADEEIEDAILEAVAKEMGCKKSVKALRGWLSNKEPALGSKEALVWEETDFRLERDKMLTFDGILYRALNMLPGNKFLNSIIVDETQDSNVGDIAIYKALNPEMSFMVGDPRQSIMSFRGSIGVIKLPGSKVFDLTENYRSSSWICGCANKLMKEYPAMEGMRSKLGVVSISEYANPQSELSFLVECIQSQSESHSIAVLARTNALANRISNHLRQDGIKVAETAQEPADWIKLKMLLAVYANPWNDILVCALADKMGHNGARIAQEAALAMKPAFEIIFGEKPHKRVLADILATLYKWVRPESETRLHEIIDQMPLPATLDALLLRLAHREPPKEGEGVFVGTVHSAKGKEWDVVFVAGCEEGLLPRIPERMKRNASGLQDNIAYTAALEEERRIFYVAITRARDALYLTHCKEREQNRGAFAPGPLEPREPSRFLKEIE